MHKNNGHSSRSLYEQIEELKSKINLIEGDRKAYYESSQYAIKKNQKKVKSYRKETSELRRRLSDTLQQDEHIINKAFNDRPVERAALSKKSGSQAITIFDHKVCDSRKRANAMNHDTVQKQKRLEELQTQYSQMGKDASDAVELDKGESTDSQHIRYLENSYDKVTMKTEEAKQIQRVYLDIKSRFEQEAQSYGSRIDVIQIEIDKTRSELKELRAMQNDAEICKETSVTELRRQEETVYSERKKREIELQKMKKEAEEKKIQHERIEKRLAQRGAMHHDGISLKETSTDENDAQQQKIVTYEEAFCLIKEATGVQDTWEVVERFENQGSTTSHLEELKKDNTKQILRLQEEKANRQKAFEEMKYSGEAKLSRGQQMLEELESYLEKDERRRDEADDNLQRSSRVLLQVKAGVGHLSDKLKQLKANKSHMLTAQTSRTSDEYVLDQLAVVEEKLMKLQEDLDGTDLNETLRQMEEGEFHGTVDGKLPRYNTRIKLPTVQRDIVYGDDDDDSGEDDADVPNRATIKKNSQIIIEAKTKRREAKKKRKMK